MKRLSVVVPYRAREAHLRFFVTELRNYFNRDKLDREIPYQVLIVEQNSELPFNRGALCNIGFALSRDDSDYTCFHDVDICRSGPIIAGPMCPPASFGMEPRSDRLRRAVRMRWSNKIWLNFLGA